MCRFFVTPDLWNVQDPKVAVQILRDHGLGKPRLEATLTQDAGDPSTYRFPADSVLVMMGQTQQLLDACTAARNAGVDWIKTSGTKGLTLRYVRIDVGKWLKDVNTLIVVGASAVVDPAFIGDWHEWTHLRSGAFSNDKLSMEPAGGTTRELPLAIRWIKENDEDGWDPPLKA
jgi:hypothetical protein